MIRRASSPQRQSIRKTKCKSPSPDWCHYCGSSRSPSPPKCSMQRSQTIMRPFVCMITTFEPTGTDRHTIPKVSYPMKQQAFLESYTSLSGKEFQPFLQGKKPTCTDEDDKTSKKNQLQTQNQPEGSHDPPQYEEEMPKRIQRKLKPYYFIINDPYDHNVTQKFSKIILRPV